MTATGNPSASAGGGCQRITLASGTEHLVTSATLYPDERAARKSRNVDGLTAFRTAA